MGQVFVHSRILFVAGLVLYSMLGPTAVDTRADEWETLELASPPLKLLNDRLRIRMPEGARLEPRRTNIMSAENSIELETRVVFERGDKKLVLMVYELLCTAGDAFDDQLRKRDEKQSTGGRKVKTSVLLEQKGFRVLQTESTPLSVDEEANLILAAWVDNRDHTIQLVKAYANPDAARDAGLRGLCARILKTLAPGDRTLDAKAGVRALPVEPGKLALAVDLPEGYAATMDQGPDFLVHRIRKICPFGESAYSIGIYIGGHPAYQHKQSDNADNLKVEKVPGELFHAQVQWFKYTEQGDTVLEAIHASPEIRPLMLHVFLSAPSEKELEAVRKVVETLRFVEDKKSPAQGDK
jgi:hypothetical protein